MYEDGKVNSGLHDLHIKNLKYQTMISIFSYIFNHCKYVKDLYEKAHLRMTFSEKECFQGKSCLLLDYLWRQNPVPYMQDEEAVEKRMAVSFLINMHMIGKMIA